MDDEEPRGFDSIISVRFDDEGKLRVHIGDHDTLTAVGILRNVLGYLEDITPPPHIEGNMGVILDPELLMDDGGEDLP